MSPALDLLVVDGDQHQVDVGLRPHRVVRQAAAEDGRQDRAYLLICSTSASSAAVKGWWTESDFMCDSGGEECNRNAAAGRDRRGAAQTRQVRPRECAGADDPESLVRLPLSFSNRKYSWRSSSRVTRYFCENAACILSGVGLKPPRRK